MVIRNLRAMGMGGAAVAIPAEDNILFYNPALLRALKYNRINLVDLSLRLNQEVLDQLNFYKDHQDQLDDFDNLSDAEKNALYADALAEAQKLGIFTVEGPLPVHFLTPRFGAGAFSAGNVSYEIFEGAAGLPLVDMRFRGEVQVMGAYAHTLSLGPRGSAGDLHLGVTAKYLRRYFTRKTKTLSGLSSNEDLHVFRGNNLGFDLGVFYVLNRRWQFGGTIYDVVTTKFKWNTAGATPDNPVPSSKINPSLRLGTAFRPGVRLGKWFYNIAVGFDVDQPFDSKITFFKKVYTGVEANFTPVFSVRGGIAQGYPTFGLGMRLYVMRADYAFYGEELGKYAGQIVSWNHALRLQLGF
ncbi:MAG: conjugal transfer protein TraF [bacterium]